MRDHQSRWRAAPRGRDEAADLAALASAEDDGAADEQPPFPLALVAGDGGQYVVSDGPAKGMRGFFVRDENGELASVHVGGRMATKI